MKNRGERFGTRGEGWLVATVLAVVLALSLAVYLAGRPGKESFHPVHALPDAVYLAEMVSLNSADADEFAQLPGIGETLAQRIVDYRREHGDFRSVEDLLNVPGIGEGKLSALRPEVFIE